MKKCKTCTSESSGNEIQYHDFGDEGSHDCLLTRMDKEGVTQIEDQQDSDNGIVQCGKCKKELMRCEAFLSIKYLYTCEPCK